MHYSSELKFVVPHFREVKNTVDEIPHQEFKQCMCKKLDMLGLNYYLTLPIKEVLDGKEYDAELIVVYCSEIMEKAFIEAFEKICLDYKEKWNIDFFTYIHNGILVTND